MSRGELVVFVVSVLVVLMAAAARWTPVEVVAGVVAVVSALGLCDIL